MRRVSRGCGGIALVEFALVVPLFLMLCIAGIDYGRVFYNMIGLTAAARAGAAYASQGSAAAADTSGTAAVVSQAAGNLTGVTSSLANFCTCSAGGAHVDCSTSCSGKASYVQVTATKTFSTVVGWPGVPGSLTTSRAAVMRVQ